MTNEHRQILENVSYSDLFSNVDDQLHITEAFQIIIETRGGSGTPWGQAYLGIVLYEPFPKHIQFSNAAV